MSLTENSEAQVEAVRGTCPKCGKQFGVPYLYHHLRRAHGIYGGATGVQRANAKSLTCDLCDRSFTSKQGLSMHHARTHRPKPAPVGPSAALVPLNGHVAPAKTIASQPRTITVVENMQVVTDGDRIGIVEWHD
jgi:uncharacterized C2H2 Zn-finger protein